MNTKEGLVSVIIPTYNRSSLCKLAVESVLTQTYPDIEVIVVDDGSTDDTREVIRGIHASVRYIHQKNAGVSAARNTGLEVANGEFIALLDSDDVWLPWKLEAQLEALRVFPDAGMVWTDMVAVNEDGMELSDAYLKVFYGAYNYFKADKHFRVCRDLSGVWKGCPSEWHDRKCYAGNIFSWMFMGNLVHTSTVLLRRERQRDVGLFDLSLKKSGEDYDFHFRTCRLGDVAYLDIPSIRYRVGAADQLTAKGYRSCIARNDFLTITKMLEHAENEIDLPDHLIKERIAHSHDWVGRSELFNNRLIARRHLGKSLIISPFQPGTALFWFLSNFPTPILMKLRELKRKILGPNESIKIIDG